MMGDHFYFAPFLNSFKIILTEESQHKNLQHNYLFFQVPYKHMATKVVYLLIKIIELQQKDDITRLCQLH